MKDLLEKSLGMQIDKNLLGNTLTSWRYVPKKSNKFLYAALSVLGGLVIALAVYGPELIPWLKKIPTIAIYALFFLISPILKYFSSLGKDQIWTLYEHGYSVLYVGKEGAGEERIGWWRDFTSATYDAEGVRLIPRNPFKKTVRIPARGNVTEIYSIARERISMAQAERIEQSVRAPARPKTREQRSLRKSEQREQRQQQAWGDSWSRFFGEADREG